MRTTHQDSALATSGALAPEYDVVVVGGGPSGATAATDLAEARHSVLLLNREGRIKPCGGAIPPRLIRDFKIPDELLVAKVKSARIVSPTERTIDMPIDGGFVGMVDRDVFDEWLRGRAVAAGADRAKATFTDLTRDADGVARVHFDLRDDAGTGTPASVRARCVIGADGANSAVARAALPEQPRPPFVFAYHEIIESPRSDPDFDPTRCDVIYRGDFSPDFYSWVFPHGHSTSVGTGSAIKGFSLRNAVGDVRRASHLEDSRTIRREGAPIPLKPMKRWDNGRDVLLVGDAAGVVAPASGEGIYYAMACGRIAAETIDEFLAMEEDPHVLRLARKRFMKGHGKVFWVLGMMQRFWYKSDKRRERFVTMCADPDVQRLTWDSYMNKELTRAKPAAHARIFFKDLGHLFGMVSPSRS